MFLWNHKIKGVSVILPSLNSEKTIGPLLALVTRYYDDVIIGIDSKTTDNTLAIASKYNCKVITINNESGYVEPIFAQFFDKCKYDWILRLDDDEFISEKLIEFTKNSLQNLDASIDAVGLHRKWCRKNDSRGWEWSIYPVYGYDWQFRLFRKDLVKSSEEFHAPGIIYKNPCFAPIESHILHLDWYYHPYEERKAKVERYEKIKTGSGHKDYYLYEDIPNSNDFLIPFDINDEKLIKKYINV